MAQTVTLGVGFTDLGWPATAPAMTNVQVLERLNADGFKPVTMTRFSGGRYQAWNFETNGGEVWQMEAGRGYQVQTRAAGVWTYPGSPAQQQCPDGQTWDVALQACKPEVFPGLDPFAAIKPLVDWAKANPFLAAGIGLGGLLILSGGLKVKI